MSDPTIYDAAAVRDALTPPEFHDGSRRVVGQLLSVEEFWHHVEWWAKTPGPIAGAIAEWNAGVRAFLDAVFPPAPAARVSRYRAWLARWLPRWAALPLSEPSVADVVLSLPSKRQYEAVQRFFGSLASEHWNVDALLAAQTKSTTTSQTTETTAPATAGPSAT